MPSRLTNRVGANHRARVAGWQGPARSPIDAAERRERIVEERGAVGLVGCGAVEEGVEQAPYLLRIEIAGDDDDAAALVGVGPGVEVARRVHDVLDAVDHQRFVRRLGELHDALDAQELRAM